MNLKKSLFFPISGTSKYMPYFVHLNIVHHILFHFHSRNFPTLDLSLRDMYTNFLYYHVWEVNFFTVKTDKSRCENRWSGENGVEGNGDAARNRDDIEKVKTEYTCLLRFRTLGVNQPIVFILESNVFIKQKNTDICTKNVKICTKTQTI